MGESSPEFRPTLEQCVKMWPTPTKSDGEGGPGTSGRDGGENLRTAVKLWPTPTNSMATVADLEQAQFAGNGNRPSYQKAKEMWTTPAARDYRSPNHNGNFKDQLPNQCGGQLNPDWVESMVGLPIGWTNPDIKKISRENSNNWPALMGQSQFDWEPPRTCGKMPNRTKRLKMCGNICVPQQVYPILQAIADIERSNHG